MIWATLLWACSRSGPGPDAAPPLDECSAEPEACPLTLGMPKITGLQADVAVTQAVRVRWTTDEPADSWVRFEGPCGPRWVGRAESVREHEVCVVGVHADVDVGLTAHSGQATSSLVTVHTAPLPPYIPTGDRLTGLDGAQPGPTLTNVADREREWPASAVLYDPGGQPLWHYTHLPDVVDARGDVDVRLTADDTVLIGGTGLDTPQVEITWCGDVVWEGIQNRPIQTHHFDKLADGSYLAVRFATDPAYPQLVLDQITVDQPDGTRVWDWNAFDHLPLDGGAIGSSHLNSVTWTEEAVFTNSRSLSQMYRIDPVDGHVAWTLGAGGDFTLTDGTWFHHQHDPELQPGGTWLFYDNGLDSEAHTRVLELAIDEDARTAEVLWSFPADAANPDPWYSEEWYSHIWGDADRLDNGNVLVTAGVRETDHASRIFELDPALEVVWALQFPPAGGGGPSLYRAERIAPRAHNLDCPAP